MRKAEDAPSKGVAGSTRAADTPLPPLQPTPTRFWDILHTTVSLTPDIPTRTADGIADIIATPLATPQDSMVLDAQGMDIHNVIGVRQASAKSALRYAYRASKLTIHFPRPVRTGDTAAIQVVYTAKPYAAPTTGGDAVEEDRGLYFINATGTMPGKPVQIWTQGETESNSHWFPTFDKPAERFTMRLNLTVPDSFSTLANGSRGFFLKGDRPGTRTDIWHMDQSIQPYAAAFAVGDFAAVFDTLWRGKEVSYYVEQPYKNLAKKIFPNTPAMLDYFSTVTGVEYPWNKYSQVVVRDFVSGAMENTTASIFGEFMLGNARELADDDGEDVVSHELFHQWFGDYVTAESWTHITLNESFATYGEFLWRRHHYGAASADEHALQALRAYLGSTASTDPPLVRTRYNTPGDVFDRVSYQKGGSILHYLHGLMGDAAFSRAMQIYLTRNALRPAETSDWRKAVEEATGEDWNWFFDQWYHRGGHPALRVSYRYDDAARRVTATVTQIGTDTTWRLPLRSAVVHADGRRDTFLWDVRKRTQTFSYPYSAAGVRPLILPDVHHWLVGRLDDRKHEHEGLWLRQLTATADFRSKHAALQAAADSFRAASSEAVLMAAVGDSLPGIRAAALQTMSQRPSSAAPRGLSQAALRMATADPERRVRTAAVSVLGAHRVLEARPLLLRLLADSSYATAGVALMALDRIDERGKRSDTSYRWAKAAKIDETGGRLKTAIWQIIGERGYPSDTAYFKQLITRWPRAERNAIASSIATHARATTSDAAFRADLRALQAMYQMEETGGGRYALAAAAATIPVAGLGADGKQTMVPAGRKSEVRAFVKRLIEAEPETRWKTAMQDVLKRL